MCAHLAVHVIASLVLFNWFSTFRTLFSIRHDPSDVFAFSRVFDLPLASYFAVARSVGLTSAFETESVAAFAADVCYAVVLVLNAVVAALVGTPPDILVIVSV
jgi:hypothetical protein